MAPDYDSWTLVCRCWMARRYHVAGTVAHYLEKMVDDVTAKWYFSPSALCFFLGRRCGVSHTKCLWHTPCSCQSNQSACDHCIVGKDGTVMGYRSEHVFQDHRSVSVGHHNAGFGTLRACRAFGDFSELPVGAFWCSPIYFTRIIGGRRLVDESSICWWRAVSVCKL